MADFKIFIIRFFLRVFFVFCVLYCLIFLILNISTQSGFFQVFLNRQAYFRHYTQFTYILFSKNACKKHANICVLFALSLHKLYFVFILISVKRNSPLGASPLVKRSAKIYGGRYPWTYPFWSIKKSTVSSINAFSFFRVWS